MSDPAPHLLIVDDDERIRGLLRKFLARHGFLVSIARDAGHARRILSGLEFDLIVMDVMMPGEDGVALTSSLRENEITTPILLLTAKGETEDRISGLEAGADDYLAKPFEPKELLLRINAILRRMPTPEPENTVPKVLHMGPIRFDIERSELVQGDQVVRLTATEVQLMRIFVENLRQPVSRTKLVEDLGRDGGQAQERAVDVQITRLRRKLETDPKQPRYLQTVRGEGYMLVPDDADMLGVLAYPIPPETAMAEYARKPGHYTDCFAVDVGGAVSIAQFVEAFYTTPLFKAERLVLRCVGIRSSDEDARQLASGASERFAAWHMQTRSDTELLMKAIGRTSSWFGVEQTGSATAPKPGCFSGRSWHRCRPPIKR